MNDDLLNQINLRKSLYRQLQSRSFRDLKLLLHFRRVRTQTNNLNRQLRNEYYMSAYHQYSRSLKKLRSLTNEVIGRKKQRIPVSIPPQELNLHLQATVHDDSASYILPHEPVHPDDLCGFTEPSADTVSTLLQGLDPLKSPSPDGIPPSLLKCFAGAIAPPLAKMINKSLSTGVVPSAFKRANVTHLKRRKRRCQSSTNYRGISLTPNLSKALKRIVIAQLEDQFSVRQPLSDTQ